MRIIKMLGILFHALLIANLLYAGAGTTGAVILKESLGARSLAMGDAYVGVASGPETIYWNPAGLTSMDKPEVSAMYFKEIADMSLMSIQYAQPLTGYGTAGLAIESFSAGDMELNYLDGSSKSVNAQTDYIINLAYGQKLGEKLFRRSQFEISQQYSGRSRISHYDGGRPWLPIHTPCALWAGCGP